MELTWEMFRKLMEASEQEIPIDHYRMMKVGNTLGVIHPKLPEPIFIVKQLQ